MTAAAPRICLIAGEDSGDILGGALMATLKARLDPPPVFAGLGGSHMRAEGIEPPFPLDDVAVMGAIAILKHLPVIWRRAHQVIDHAVAFRPDVIVIIDSPEFTHPIARRLRKRLPGVPILDYVSPSVWAWRSYRARKMRSYIDEVLALLPFEPEAYRELDGPACTYVGHPLSEEVARLKSDGAPDRNRVLILPGSRRSEVERLMPIFSECVARLAAARPGLHFVLPAADAQVARVRALAAEWPVRPEIVEGRENREAAMRGAMAAIAASGTVTLELALARVPMVVCYKIDWLIATFRSLLRAHSVVLANLVAGGNDIPELIHKDCTVERILAEALPLLDETALRQRQMTAFDRVEAAMKFDGPSPSERAAGRVMAWLERLPAQRSESET
ncbi:MAG: lipid-A-disaccharide synthase [Rhodobiaceae bacterium]|nr:lipid-A-disaccharide synthase [Rhodobiaceae bacterium]